MELEAIVPLKSLLVKTIDRLLLIEGALAMFENLAKDFGGIVTLNMCFSWGLDGTGSQAVYHQTNEDGDVARRETNLLATQLVILQISCVPNSQVIWQNKRSNSAISCRPLRYSYQKEDKDAVVAEYSRVNSEIDALEEYSPNPSINFIFTDFNVPLSLPSL